MTHLAIKGDIAPQQMDMMLQMLRSWNLETEVRKEYMPHIAPRQVQSALPLSVGLWDDYDIDDQTLRAKAWGSNKTTAQ